MDDAEQLRQAARMWVLERKQRNNGLDADEAAELEVLQANAQALLTRDLDELTSRVNAWREANGYSPLPPLGPLAPKAQVERPPRPRLVYARRDQRNTRRGLPGGDPDSPPPKTTRKA
jgi:hypothetical protein